MTRQTAHRDLARFFVSRLKLQTCIVFQKTTKMYPKDVCLKFAAQQKFAHNTLKENHLQHRLR
jgi:hypothetical protein